MRAELRRSAGTFEFARQTVREQRRSRGTVTLSPPPPPPNLKPSRVRTSSTKQNTVVSSRAVRPVLFPPSTFSQVSVSEYLSGPIRLRVGSFNAVPPPFDPSSTGQRISAAVVGINSVVFCFFLSADPIMGRYAKEPRNPTKSCKARGSNLRVHFKVSPTRPSERPPPGRGRRSRFCRGPINRRSVNVSRFRTRERQPRPSRRWLCVAPCNT